MVKHLNIRIVGEVQDINFRSFLKTKAQGLGIAGFVRNDPDGTVYTEAEGEESDLSDYLNYCHQGPRFARVEKVDVWEGQLKKFGNFEIKY